MARKKVVAAQLLPGVLLENDQVRLELTFEDGEGCELLTPTHKDKPQSYFNFTPKGKLAALVSGYLEGWRGQAVPLHRVIVAASGRFVPKDCDIHHIDHNHHNNQAENLEVVDRLWHLDHHKQHPRLPNDPQLAIFTHQNGLRYYLKATFPTPLATPPGVYAEGWGAAGSRGAAARPLNPRRLSDAGSSDLESVFDVAGDPFGVPEHRRRTWKARELQRLGLARQVANAAGWTLRAARKLGSNARAGQIVRLVTAKGASSRTAYRALGWLVSEGFIEKHDSRFYRLTDAAWTVEETRR